jgi:hypothetical protein
MKRNHRALLAATVATIALALTSAANAADGKSTGEFGWFGVGKAYEVEKGHFYWVGEFSGTFFNDKGEGSPMHRAGVKCPAWSDSNLNTDKFSAGGYCMITDLEGDQIYCTWSNTGSPKNGSKNAGTFECTGSSGKYKSIKAAKNTFVGVTQVNWADGTG